MLNFITLFYTRCYIPYFHSLYVTVKGPFKIFCRETFFVIDYGAHSYYNRNESSRFNSVNYDALRQFLDP